MKRATTEVADEEVRSTVLYRSSGIDRAVAFLAMDSAETGSTNSSAGGLLRASLREQIREQLIRRILSGYYQPEDRLVELRLAQEFGTSQTPVREALRELEMLGFVESQPFRGTRVRSVTRDELGERYPVRAALEELAGRLAATRINGDVSYLEAELAEMREAEARGDIHAEVEHDVKFHEWIVRAADNRALLNVWSSLLVESSTLITVLGVELEPGALSGAHLEIIEALRSGDPSAAGAALRNHLEYFGGLFAEASIPARAERL
jgi:DNA-binding GntR family transcriptional regulator